MNKRLFACVCAAVATLMLPSSGWAQSPPASEADQIRQELKQLKQDYEERIRRLEERLRQMEKTTAAASNATPVRPEAVVATAPLPAPEVASPPGAPTNAASLGQAYARQQFQPDTESRDHAILMESHPIRERVEHVLQDFVDITGYFRAGYGRNDQGGSQVGFQAPGAFAKYRLGNEAENYGELAFGKNFYVPDLFKLDKGARADGTPTGPIARVQVRMSIYNPYQELLSSGDTDFGLPEAWASIGNVVEAQPSMKFWAGSRFYRRQDIHINDFYFFNMSGTGGGVEDIELPFGQLALSWIGAGSRSGVSDLPEPTPANEAGFSKGNWDLRLYDVPLPLGKGEFALVYANASSGKDADGNSAPGSDGFAFTFLHKRDGFLSQDGINKLSLQYGTGPGKTFTSGFETYTVSDAVYIRPDYDNSWRFRVTEHFTANLNDHFSIGPATLYQITDYGDVGGLVQWASLGVRPIWHYNKFFSVAFEGGVDWVQDHDAATSGYLYKLTLAPQVSLGGRFMSRPVIRAFITYAHWANDFMGQVGGNDYIGLNEGWTFGTQMES